jgi:hypothetical protein
MKTLAIPLLLLLASPQSPAQKPQPPKPAPVKTIVPCPRCLHRVVKNKPSPTASTSPAADFFVSEARVDVTRDETVVRLAMAQHGSVLIELPANDGPRYIIPGDPEMATVDEKALERNKRAIVVRPGSSFLAPLPNRRTRNPAATVTAQMRSGLVVTFLFYPVEDLAQNVHRCVLNYNRDEVVARRRAAGLPVNLDDRGDDKTSAQSTAPASLSVEDVPDAVKSTVIPIAPVSSTVPDTSNRQNHSLSTALSTMKQSKVVSDTSAEAVVRDAVQEATGKPGRFKHWTKPAHGLSLSIIQPSDSVNEFKVVTVAVRNTTRETLKLTSDAPDLSLEMQDEKGKPLNTQTVRKLHTAASDASGVVPPGARVYYAVAFAPPVLGVHQQLKIFVSQTSAADEPASIMLANAGR